MIARQTEDGVRLLMMEDLAEMTGLTVMTIRNYNTAGARLARAHGSRPAKCLPEPYGYVQRTFVKNNGQRGAAPTPLWREDDIRAWAARTGRELAPLPSR